MSASTNATIATLRALTCEIHRIERKLRDENLSDEDSEELGIYAMDLQEALASVSDEYEMRRREDSTLTDVNILLKYFSSQLEREQAD